jgi:hypothetical protein
MLAALLKLHSDSQVAEHNIAIQRERLHQLTRPEEEFGPSAARRAVDAAQRLACAVTARDAHHAAAAAVLRSLRRAERPSDHRPPIASTPDRGAGPALSADMLRAR